jgi:hypothetical protein
MAELSEAFNTIKFEQKNFHSIDYFFTQRNLKEDHEFLDQHLNRKNKQVNIQYNFLAINIPQYNLTEGTHSIIEADIYGDNGYQYKGTIMSYKGFTPNFMIPLKGDKKLFVHLVYKDSNKENEQKEFICFIEVPKRFQSSSDALPQKIKNESETSIDI